MLYKMLNNIFNIFLNYLFLILHYALIFIIILVVSYLLIVFLLSLKQKKKMRYVFKQHFTNFYLASKLKKELELVHSFTTFNKNEINLKFDVFKFELDKNKIKFIYKISDLQTSNFMDKSESAIRNFLIKKYTFYTFSNFQTNSKNGERFLIGNDENDF